MSTDPMAAGHSVITIWDSGFVVSNRLRQSLCSESRISLKGVTFWSIGSAAIRALAVGWGDKLALNGVSITKIMVAEKWNIIYGLVIRPHVSVEPWIEYFISRLLHWPRRRSRQFKYTGSDFFQEQFLQRPLVLHQQEMGIQQLFPEISRYCTSVCSLTLISVPPRRKLYMYIQIQIRLRFWNALLPSSLLLFSSWYFLWMV